MAEYVLGVMSGTSLDGIDVALCRFNYFEHQWKFTIIDADTLPYTQGWKERLEKAPNLSTQELLKLHKSYGYLIGDVVNKFLAYQEFKPSIIASHGHTIFHQPDDKFTFQIGDANFIKAKTGPSPPILLTYCLLRIPVAGLIRLTAPDT